MTSQLLLCVQKKYLSRAAPLNPMTNLTFSLILVLKEVIKTLVDNRVTRFNLITNMEKAKAII